VTAGTDGGTRLPRSLLRWVFVLLPPLVVLLILGVDLIGRLSATRYPTATGVTGELLAGHGVGQTFVAQHDGLAAVDLLLATYARRNPGEVVLHLRRTAGAGPDLATVRLPAATLADNGWQRFAFPPLTGSRGQAYVFELEQPGAVPGRAITVYWWHAQGDPYPYGQALLDGAPQSGDLAFGLDYQPDPVALLADVRTTLSDQIPAGVGRLLGAAGLAGLLLLGILVRGTVCGWWAGSLRRRVLLGGILTAFALAHGSVWLAVIPPWQGPDEFAHYAYSVLLAAGVNPTTTDPAAQAVRRRVETEVLAAMDAHGFTRTVDWYAIPGGPAAGFTQPTARGTTLFIETRQPAFYYWLGALALRSYSRDPAGVPADLGLYLVRTVSVGVSALVVLLAWGLAHCLAPGVHFRLLWLTLPLTVALLPMRVFIDSMANNDVLAECAVSALALVLGAWLVRAPAPLWRSVILVALGVGLAAASLRTKTSTTIAAAPVLWLGSVLAAGFLWLRRLRGRGATVGRRIVAMGLLVTCGTGGLLLAQSVDTRSAALAWVGADGRPAHHRPPADAPTGPAVLDLPAGQEMEQRLTLPADHPAYMLTLRLWVRPPICYFEHPDCDHPLGEAVIGCEALGRCAGGCQLIRP